MVWKTFKFLLSAICLSIVVLVFAHSPHLGIKDIVFASLFIFLAAGLWVDYTKPQDSQNLTPAGRKLSKVVIWGLVIIFTIMFIGSFASSDAHVNSSGFIKLILALLKAL